MFKSEPTAVQLERWHHAMHWMNGSDIESVEFWRYEIDFNTKYLLALYEMKAMCQNTIFYMVLTDAITKRSEMLLESEKEYHRGVAAKS